MEGKNMDLKKTSLVILQILLICVVFVGCGYLVEHMYYTMHFKIQRFPAIGFVIVGAMCIVAFLIIRIKETIQK